MADDTEEPEEDGKEPGGKKSCTLSPTTVRYLEKLKEVGTHGTTVSAVMARLIEEGVRRAIRQGFIQKLER